MAFDEATRVQVRFSLGFSDVFRQNDPRLEGALDVVQDRPDTVTLIQTILANIQTVQTSVLTSLSGAGLKRAEDIEWYEGNGPSGSAYIDGQRSIGRQFCNQLSIILGVPLQADIFGEAGYTGDAWMGAGFQMGGLINSG